MGEEVRIVAVIDSSQISSGIQRIEQAAERIKTVVQEATTPEPGAAGESGEKIAEDLSAGFLKKLLIRDVIKEAVKGVQEIIKDTAKDLEELTGIEIKLDPWREWANVLTNALMSISGINRAVVNNAELNIQNIKDSEKSRVFLSEIKNNPQKLKASALEIERNIENTERQKAEDAINNQRLHQNKAAVGRGMTPALIAAMLTGGGIDSRMLQKDPIKSDGANISDEELKKRNKQSDEELRMLREELAVAKRRDKDNLTESKNDTAAAKKEEAHQAKMQKDLETSIEKSMQHFRHHEKEEAAKKKREERVELSVKEREDHEKHRRAEVDLHETERNLHAQKATSAVRIHGGLFGKSDSAAQLVQHAAQQVNILRGIESELKAIRHQKDDLTLN